VGREGGAHSAARIVPRQVSVRGWSRPPNDWMTGCPPRMRLKISRPDKPPSDFGRSAAIPRLTTFLEGFLDYMPQMEAAIEYICMY
jgi:hypothetical protein